MNIEKYYIVYRMIYQFIHAVTCVENEMLQAIPLPLLWAFALQEVQSQEKNMVNTYTMLHEQQFAKR